MDTPVDHQCLTIKNQCMCLTMYTRVHYAPKHTAMLKNTISRSPMHHVCNMHAPLHHVCITIYHVFTTLHTCAQLKTECVQVTTLSFKIMVVLQIKHGVWWWLLIYCSAQKSKSGGTGGLPCSVFCIRNTNQLS